MNTNSRINSDLARDIFIFEDESNLQQSQMDRIFPTTSIDQVFDFIDSNEPKTLRQILADLKIDLFVLDYFNIIFLGLNLCLQNFFFVKIEIMYVKIKGLEKKYRLLWDEIYRG